MMSCMILYSVPCRKAQQLLKSVLKLSIHRSTVSGIGVIITKYYFDTFTMENMNI